MSQYTTGVNYNSSSGFFEVSKVDSSGKVTTENVNFSTLCMMFSLDSLNAQDEVFATQFAEAEAQVSQLTMINDCMQMLNKYVAQAEGDKDKSVTLNGMGQAVPNTGPMPAYDPNTQGCADIGGYYVPYTKGTDAEAWCTVYYPNLIATGLVQDGDASGNSTMGIGVDGICTYEELSVTMENLQSAQSTVSSQNEQQMLLTNDAANKRSSILQQAQTLLQAAHDARKTAAQT